MKVLIFHFALCAILFGDYFYDQSLNNKKFYQYQRTPALLKQKPKISNKTHKEFVYSIVTGKKRGFRKSREYNNFKKAGMLHLLTPSGLHLSSLLIPIYFFVKSRLLKNIFFILFGVLLFYLPGFEAAKRIWGLKLALVNIKNLKPVFYFVFSLAFLIKPGLSFLMSFFFLGIIIHNPFQRISSTLLLFSAAQVLISAFFNQEYYPLGILINPLATIFITMIFPFIFIGYFLPTFYQSLVMPVIDVFFSFVEEINILPPIFDETLLSVGFLLFIIMNKKWKYKSVGLLGLLAQPMATI